MNLLESYGATGDRFAAAAHSGLYLARILSQTKELYRIATERGEGLAEVSGKLRHEARQLSQYPAVGDFVLVDRLENAAGYGVIHRILPRKSLFVRAAAGQSGQSQVVAANIDIVFLCMALYGDYNIRRLERYLSIAWDSGATPVAVLTKGDLCADLGSILAEIAAVAVGVDVIVTDKENPASWHALLRYLKPGVTASFIGSSGVGKSTLINRLAGSEQLATAAIRQDGKGRHTTTRRELLLLPQGGIVIDTPGMREVGVVSVDLEKAFADIEGLAAQCKFHDCSHTAEPGCAVQAAIAGGSLDGGRLENFRKIQREARYEGLSAREIEAEKIQTMFGGTGAMKEIKRHLKEKNKRR